MKRFPRIVLCACALLLTGLAWAKPQGEFPPAVAELTIDANGKRMPGLAYIAQGAGPHPAVLLLHGYPGNEKNLDMAQALRSQGWTVVFFHYRGAWGSEGEFSFTGAERDVQTVLDYMRAPANATALRIDPEHISVVGHSMGGHMAVSGILGDAQVRCAVSLDGANLGTRGGDLFNNPERVAMWKGYSDQLFMLAGWSGDKALKEFEQRGKALDLLERIDHINGRPILFIAADSEVIPLDSQILPLVEALRDTDNSKVEYVLIDDDHSFSASRGRLIATTASFLDKHCQ